MWLFKKLTFISLPTFCKKFFCLFLKGIRMINLPLLSQVWFEFLVKWNTRVTRFCPSNRHWHRTFAWFLIIVPSRFKSDYCSQCWRRIALTKLLALKAINLYFSLLFKNFFFFCHTINKWAGFGPTFVMLPYVLWIVDLMCIFLTSNQDILRHGIQTYILPSDEWIARQDCSCHASCIRECFWWRQQTANCYARFYNKIIHVLLYVFVRTCVLVCDN